MRRVVVLALVAAGAVGATSCGRTEAGFVAPKRFCVAAQNLDRELDRQAAANDLDLDRQIRLVRRLVEASPAKVEADARTFLSALERVRTDPSVKGDPEVKAAVDRVNRYAAQGCGFFERRSPI